MRKLGEENMSFARFTGDNNEALKQVQRDTCWNLLPFLFTYPRGIYLRAVSYIGSETELSKEIRSLERIDHRVLLFAHYKIAAYYRYQHPDKLGQLVLPFAVPDCEGLTPEEILVNTYKREWSSYWYEEVRTLSEEPIIVRTILRTIVYQHTDDGEEAEEFLRELLHERYGKSWDRYALLIRDFRSKHPRYLTMKLPPEIEERLFCNH